MKTKQLYLGILATLLASASLLSQQATVRGVILDEENTPVTGANVVYENNGTLSQPNGYYELNVPANQDVRITFSHISHKNVSLVVNLQTAEDYEFNPVMKTDVAQMA
ncbi:MAG: carboxypeptidase-like regulatory domain-containing protein, partial [Marinirhabdus sp.]